MLKEYKKVSIIYGGEGARLAKALQERLFAYHEEEHYPLSVQVVLETITPNEILRSVIPTIKGSDFCILILSKDDVGANASAYQKDHQLKPRLRQNVLIEYGMALLELWGVEERNGASTTTSNHDRIIAFCNFDPKKEEVELPSDITNSFGYIPYDDEHMDEAYQKVLVQLHNLFGEKTHQGLLRRKDYQVRYVDAFNETMFMQGLRVRREFKKITDILEMWKETISSFTFPSESYIYALEVTILFPLCAKGKEAVDYLYDFKNKIRYLAHSKEEEEDGISYRKILDLVQTVIAYTITKSDRHNENDELEYRSEYATLTDVQAYIEGALKAGKSFNPLLLFALYDYLGLCALRLASYQNGTGKENHLRSALSFFLKAEEIAAQVDDEMKYFEGFLSYNLARCHQGLYQLNGQEEERQQMEQDFAKTLTIRYDWLNHRDLLPVYRNALSYEYFVAKSSYTRALLAVHSFSPSSALTEEEKIVAGIDQHLSFDSGLSSLCDLRNAELRFIEELKKSS